MKRIYHTWDKWECFPAGMYETVAPNGMTAKQANEEYAKFLKNIKLFESCLSRVIVEWVKSCEHYLSNEKMNRIAWLGQASICLHSRIPQGFRGGYNLLSQEEKDKANRSALKFLNLWLKKRGEPAVDLEQAGVNNEVNLY